MNNLTKLVVTMIMILPAPSPLLAQKTTANPTTKTSVTKKSVEGTWKGALAVGGIELRLVAHLKQNAEGTLTGTLDSPDQNAAGIKITKGQIKGNAVRIEISSIRGVFEGKLSADGTKIVGTWAQGAGLPLTLTKTTTDAIATELERPQNPKKPYPYKEEDVTYQNKKDNTKLAGTLTIPQGDAPFPVVILITGSGPQDRDESLLGHKPFLVLSDYLTRLGIAVLRVDDRGVGGSSGNIALSTTDDFVGDVLTSVDYLKTRKEIDPKRIGLIGHSEGGIIAPAAAARSKDVAFIVLMAGTGLPGSDILYMQSALIAKAGGAPNDAIAFNRKVMEQMFAVMKSEKDNDKAVAKMKEEWKKIKADVPADKQKEIAAADASIEPQFRQLLNPWFRYFIDYDPRTALKQVACPVLAINGEFDLQVPAKEDLAEIEAALKAGGNKDYTVVLLPKLNHLFQTTTTGSPAEYGRIKETIAPVALKTMGDWILKRVAK